MRGIRDTAILTGLLFRRLRGDFLAFAGASLVLPACGCYAAFMIAADDPATLHRWVAGSLVLALGLASLAHVCMAMAQDRHGGALALLRPLALGRGAHLASYLVLGVVLALIVAGCAAVLLVATGLEEASPVLVARLGLSAVLGGFSLGALGAAIGAHAPSIGASDVGAGAASIGLVLLSPVFYSQDALHPMLKAITWTSPYTHLAKLMPHSADATSLPMSSVLSLALFGSVASVVALSRPPGGP
jgi:hypothetical protein